MPNLPAKSEPVAATALIPEILEFVIMMPQALPGDIAHAFDLDETEVRRLLVSARFTSALVDKVTRDVIRQQLPSAFDTLGKLAQGDETIPASVQLGAAKAIIAASNGHVDRHDATSRVARSLEELPLEELAKIVAEGSDILAGNAQDITPLRASVAET